MILVFGSINIDLLMPVPHLPRPGETVLGGEYALLPGGKGANQALAARRAGAAVRMAGAVGDDAFAAPALEGLRRGGVDLALVRRVARPTGCATILVGPDGENVIAVASGANAEVTAAQVPDEALRPDTVLVLQMEVPSGETAALIRRAASRGARIVLNLAPALPLERGLWGDIDVIVANEVEAASLGEDPARVGATTRQGFVITRGADGAAAFLSDGSSIAMPSLPIEPVDTTGAGDTFVGVFAAGLDRGFGLAAALRRASAAAALACLARGAQTAMPDTTAIDDAVRRLRIEGAASLDRPRRSSLISGVGAGEVFAEFEEHVLVNPALEWDDQLGQAGRLNPFPGIEFGMLGREVDFGIAAGKAHRKPFLTLAAVAAAPHMAGDLPGQVVMVPEAALGEYFGLVGADLLGELAQRRLARRLAGVDAALRHLPGGEAGRHIDAPPHKDETGRIDQHDADPRPVGLQFALGEAHPTGRCRRRPGQFTRRPLNRAMPRSMSTARAS
jgi:ribokinase